MGVLDILGSTTEATTDVVDADTMFEAFSVAGGTAATLATGGAAAAAPIAILTGKIVAEETVKDYIKKVGKQGYKSVSQIADQHDQTEASKLGVGRACAGVCTVLDPLFDDDETDIEQLVYQDPNQLNRLIKKKLSGDGPDHDQLREVEAAFQVMLLGAEPPDDVTLDFDPTDGEALKNRLIELFDADDEQEAIQLFMLYQQFLADVTQEFTDSVNDEDLSEKDQEVLVEIKRAIRQMEGRIDDFIQLYLRVGVRNQGFKHLTLDEFRLRDTFEDTDRSPIEAWKGGFTFAELAEQTEDDGRYYFERPLPDNHGLRFKTTEAETISDAIVERLVDGQHLVVLGEPGMGKSHLCQLAATEWVNQEFGEVFYRETAEQGQGEFNEHAELEEIIKRAQDTHGGHVLVVVEDVTRDQSRLIFEVMKEFHGKSHVDVSFLLDSRPYEWKQYTNRHDGRISPPYGFLDEDSRYLEEHEVPPVSRGDCERAIQVFNKTTKGYYDGSAKQLHETVFDGKNGRGELLALIDTLVRKRSFEDRPPIAANATTVHEEVWESINLDDRADRLYYEVVVGSTLLSAAEIGVQTSLLYALAENSRDDIKYIENLLKGRSVKSQLRSEPVPYELPETFVFPTDGESERQRSRHPTWSTLFLAHHIKHGEIDEPDFHDVVVDVVDKMAGLADNPKKRQGIKRQLEADPTYLKPFDENPTDNASGLLIELYQLATREEQLQPLIGARETGDGWGKPTVFDGGIAVEAVPDTCSEHLTYELLLIYADSLVDWHSSVTKKREQLEFLQKLETRANEHLVQPESQPVIAQIQRQLADSAASASSVDWETAQEYYQVAIGIYRDIGDLSEVAAAQRGLASAASVSRVDWETTEQYYQAAIETYREIGDLSEVARTQEGLARATMWASSADWETTEQYYLEGIESYGEIGDISAVARTQQGLASAARSEPSVDWETTEQYYQAAIETYRDSSDVSTVAEAQQDLASAAADVSGADWETTEQYYQAAIETYRDISNLSAIAGSQQDLASVARLESNVDWETTEQYYLEAINIYRDIGNLSAVAEVQQDLASAAADTSRADWETAEQYYLEAINIYRDIGNLSAVAEVQQDLASAAADTSRADWETAQEYYQVVIDIYRDIGDLSEVAAAQRGLANAASASRVDWETTEQYYLEAIDIYRDIGNLSAVARTQQDLASAAADVSGADWETTEQYYLEAIGIYRDISNLYAVAEAQQDLASAAADASRADWETTEQYYLEAIDIYRDIGNLSAVAEAQQDLACAAADTSHTDWETAEQYYEEAIKTATDISAEYLLSEIHISLAKMVAVNDEMPWMERCKRVDRAIINACACEPYVEWRVKRMFENLFETLETLAEAALNEEDPDIANKWVDIVTEELADRTTATDNKRLDEIRAFINGEN